MTTVTLRIDDVSTRERLKTIYPCEELGNNKLKVTTNDMTKLMKELKDIWP